MSRNSTPVANRDSGRKSKSSFFSDEKDGKRLRSKRSERGTAMLQLTTSKTCMAVLFVCIVICSLFLNLVFLTWAAETNKGGGVPTLQSFVEKGERLSEKIVEDIGKGFREMAGKKAQYAYCWVVGGIHEDRYSYKGFLYTVAIAANILQKKGSNADFVLWAQLAPDSKLNGKLPDEDERLLREVGVQVRMLETVEKDSFTQLVYEKFRSLSMTEYERVIFLDGDIMPRSNMDYVFHLSKEGILRQNLILATKGEPCNTAMFMVTPSDSNWDLMQAIIKRRHDEGAKMPYPHFSKKIGWGWNMEEHNTPWESINKKRGWRWAYHASHSDQGLFYYYARFALQDVSIVLGHRLQTFVPGDDGVPKMILDGVLVDEIEKIGLIDLLPPDEPITKYNCNGAKKRGDASGFVCNDLPYKSFFHFSGNDKPWQHGLKHEKKKVVWYEPAKWWFDELDELNDKFDLGLDIDNWMTKHSDFMGNSTFGYLSKYWELQEIISAHNKTKKSETTAMEVTSLEMNHPTGGAAIDDTKGDNGVASASATGASVVSQKTSDTTIAYVVSFIQCSNFQSSSAGLVDASLILRHSIHKNSVRNPASGSKYDYKMYAIVHSQAETCSTALKHAGFEVIVVDPPVSKDEIRGDYLRTHMHREFCCGHDEFVKLYAYNKIQEKFFVHLDIDFAVYRPMDHLFDALLYDKGSAEGKLARSRIERERDTDLWPDHIEAFITRDWHQVAPGKFPPGYQAGFVVARTDAEVFNEIIEVIKEGNYTEGWGLTRGWGNKGYGGYVGAMAMQGLMGYYYDHIRPNTAVELNQCRFNHMGLDVRFNKPPNFSLKYGRKGQCRNNNPADVCEDCMVTDHKLIYGVHYTMCRKPWQCMAKPAHGGKLPGGKRGSAINIDTVHLDHCLMLQNMWHSLRSDLENELFKLTGDTTIKEASTGTYLPDVFLGHCTENGNDGYLQMTSKPETFSRFSEIYGD